MSKPRILIVENESITAEDIKRSVHRLGYSALPVVSSGEAAIQKAEKDRPDLVLMDIMLEGEINGIEAAAQIRTSFCIPVVYLTAYTDDQIIEDAKFTEPFGYIIKPFEDREIKSNIEMALHNHKMEKKFKESEEKYRGLFDESIAAVYLFDEKKNFLDSNQAGLELLGYSREELLSMSIPDVDADPKVVLPAHEQLLSGHRIINYEHKLLRKDGKVITVLNNSRPLANDDGQIFGMQSTLIDITERKNAEEVIKKKSKELENLNTYFVDREFQMIKLKKEINELLIKAGGEEKYFIHKNPK